MIQRVVAPNPGPMTGTGTNTYLIRNGGGEVAVIDPGPDDARHLDAILDAARRLGRITAVLVTHRHVDHLPGARPLCQASGAPLLGHPDLPGVERPLRDGELAFGTLQALVTPGHTDDSLCFWDPTERSLFTGDLVAGAGTVVLDERPGALAAYLSSLQRLLDLDPAPRTIYPGHGPIVAAAPARLAEYLAHRAQREQQVLQVLADRQPHTVDELVGAIYTDVPTALVPMAARNVHAHLDKLQADGRVAVRSDHWQLIA